MQDNEHLGWILPLGTAVFLSAHQIGLGPLSWLLAVELLPSRSLEISSTLTFTTWWAFQLLFAMTLTRLLQTLGLAILCWMHVIVGCLVYGFVLEMLPDIRGVSLEEIELFYARCSRWGFNLNVDNEEEDEETATE